jgi:hypothetical protein
MIDLLFLGPFVGIALLVFALWRGSLPYSRSVFSWLLVGVLVAAAIVWPLACGVWPPDIFTFGSSRTLARVTAPSGATYEVAQYRNHFDFYTTELRITSPDAKKKVIELDCDDEKSWSVPISVDEATGMASVTLSGNRTKRINLHEGTTSYDTKT